MPMASPIREVPRDRQAGEPIRPLSGMGRAASTDRDPAVISRRLMIEIVFNVLAILLSRLCRTC
jgi:hypothetical protein